MLFGFIGVCNNFSSVEIMGLHFGHLSLPFIPFFPSSFTYTIPDYITI